MEHLAELFPFGPRGVGYTAASFIAGLAGGGALALPAIAAAKSPATLSIATNVPVKNNLDSVVVNPRGLTVYTLSGENVHHLQCTKANTCFKFWLPVQVNSARTKLTAARGIKGKLGTLHRDGIYQVTLGGRPLYTFIGDGTKRRSATGEGIVSFGGTWHVIALRSQSSRTSTMSTTTASTTTTSTSNTSSASNTTPTYPY